MSECSLALVRSRKYMYYKHVGYKNVKYFKLIEHLSHRNEYSSFVHKKREDLLVMIQSRAAAGTAAAATATKHNKIALRGAK